MSILRKVRLLSKRWFGKKGTLRRKVKKIGSKPSKPAPKSVPYTPPQRSSRYEPAPTSNRAMHDTALEQLGRGAVSAFGSDLQSLVSDSKDVMKSLFGDFFSDKGYEITDSERVYKTFFEHTSVEGKYLGLNRTYDNNVDAFTHSLQQRTTQILDTLVSKDTLPPIELQSRMNRVNRETSTLSSRGAFGTLSDPYVRRPGVGIITDLIAQADTEIVIDLFQLQNRTVLDALEQKVRDNPSIQVSVRVSLPDSKTIGKTGFDILGPNLLSLERLRRVKEELGDRGNIELFVQDRKSHQKILVTDKFGIIGSLNLTSPVGYDPNQAGSNYEVVRKVQTRTYSEGQYAAAGRVPTAEEEVLISSSDKLYRQLQESVGNRAALSKDPSQQMRLNQGQVVGAEETYTHLRSSLDLMKGDNDNQFYGILNQVFLLTHEESIFKDMLGGEMGKFSDPNDARRESMKALQTELLDLVIGGRAFVAVDNKNYIERVLNPMYDRTAEMFKGTALPTNSLEELVGRVGYDPNRAIPSFMERVQAAVGDDVLSKGFNEDYVRQLLSITSGNIRLTTVPMQHSKQFMVLSGDGIGEALASQISGSSNWGPFSMGNPNLSPEERARTNREYGIALFRGNSGIEQGSYALSDKELEAELGLAKDAFSKDWNILTRTNLGDVRGRPTSPWYEDRVDKAKLEQLFTRLTEITTSLGTGVVSYIYGGRSGTERTGLSLAIDTKKLAGFGEGQDSIPGKGTYIKWNYTVISGGMGGDEGYVLDITSGRLISRSLVHNTSTSALKVRAGDVSVGVGQESLLNIANAFSRDHVTVDPNRSVILNPVGTATSLISTLLMESTNRSLLWGPEQYLNGLNTYQKRTLIEKYLDSFIPGNTLQMQAANSDRSSITNLSDSLARVLSGKADGALGRVREWTGGKSTIDANVMRNIEPLLSSLAYGFSMEEHEKYGLEDKTLPEVQAIISDKDMERVRLDRAGAAIRAENGLVDILLPLLDTSPEFRLAVVQSTVAKSDPIYSEVMTSGISSMKSVIMETYLLQAEVWRYSGSQGQYRLPIYSVTDKYQELLDTLKGTSYSNIAYQAMMIPKPLSPYTNLGTGGLHRNVAGGSNNPGTDPTTGYTIADQPHTSVATIMHHRISSSMGVGFSTTRQNIESSALSDAAKERALKIFDERAGGDDEVLTYLFGGTGKVAQIPQRLKNVQGQRGMNKLSKAFIEKAVGKGDFLQYAQEYRKTLEDRLRERFNTSRPYKTPNQVQDMINKVMPEQDTVLAAAFDLSVRGVMSGDQAAILEAYERALLEMG